MNKIISILSISTIILLSGCSEANKSLTPHAINVKPVQKKMDSNFGFHFNIKQGETLNEAIKVLSVKKDGEKNSVTIVNKISEENNIIFKENLRNFSLNDLKYYLKEVYNKKLKINKYSDKLYIVSIEDMDHGKNKLSQPLNNRDYIFVSNKPIIVSGNFTYREVFSLIDSQGIKILTTITDPKILEKNSFEFNGNISEYLNSLAEHENLFLSKISKNKFLLKSIETKIYNISIPKLPPELSETDLSNIKIIKDPGTSPIETLDKQLSAIAKDKGRYYLDKTSGIVTITADYTTIEIFNKVIQNFEGIYGKSIKLELNVYEVALNNNKSFGVNFNALKDNLIGNGSFKLSANLASSFTNTANTLILSSGMPNSDGVKPNSAVFNFLNKYGKASVITKPSLETINNVPVRLDIIDSVDYVKKVETTSNFVTSSTSTLNTNTAVGNSVTLDIDTAKTGYSLILFPKKEGDLVKIAIKNISSTLNSLKPYTYGQDNANTIFLKDISTRQFNQTVSLKEGEIAIIGGYMYDKKDSIKNGLPLTGPEDELLDSVTSAKESNFHKVEIIITISAKVI